MRFELSRSDALAPWQYRVVTSERQTSLDVDPVLRVTIGPNLPTARILDAMGREVGLLLGFAINLKAETVIRDDYRLDVDIGNASFDFAERIRDGLGGNFLIILHSAGKFRIYPDGVAQMPCVFARDQKCAGSTAYAILDEADYKSRFLKDRFTAQDIERDGWFPAGLTAHKGVERLLPNHYLDLSNWKAVRFWPKKEIEKTENPGEVAQEIVSIVQCQLRALIKSDKKVIQALTAGYETRWLLACARPLVDEIEFVTVEAPSANHIDIDIACRLAKKFELKHRILPRRMASPEEQSLYLLRGGHCSGGQNQVTHPSMWPLTAEYCFVGGLNGEIARGYTWRPGDTTDMNVDILTLVARLGLPLLDDMEERFRYWRDGVSLENALDLLDLNYLENRMGAWAYAHFFCDPSVPRYNPIGTPHTVKLMLSLPEDWRRTYRLCDFAIKQCWPELLSIPINTRGRLRDLTDKIGLAMSNPERVIRKLRKLAR